MLKRVLLAISVLILVFGLSVIGFGFWVFYFVLAQKGGAPPADATILIVCSCAGAVLAAFGFLCVLLSSR